MRTLSRQILRSVPLHRPIRRAYSTYKTQATRSARSPTIFGAALVVAGVVGWRLTRTGTIALDAQPRPSHTSTQLSAHVDENEGIAQPRISGDTSAGKTGSDSKPPPASHPPQSDSGQLEQPEEESEGEAAFNPETGEINWDCPCLGGMAHGPCGLQFREAFSCFVFSEQEPKGIDCIEKFRLMQECFREHPDVYGEELTGDDEADETPDSQSPSESSFVPAGSPHISEPTSQPISESQSQPSTST